MQQGTGTVSVVGAGRVGTALAALAAEAGSRVCVWDADRSVVKAINEGKSHPSRFFDATLPDRVSATADLKEVCRFARVLVLAVQGSALRETAGAMGEWLGADQMILHACTRIEASGGDVVAGSRMIMEECCVRKTAVLAGPLLEGELLGRAPAAMVVASDFRQVAASASALFTSSRFQVFESRDVIGVELGAALSEVYAVACGIADGLNFGAGTTGLLVTRSLAEMARFGAVLNANTATFSGLSGLGDLTACVKGGSCPAFQLGLHLGRGSGLEQAADKVGCEVEGVHTAGVAAAYARSRNVPMPILMRVCAVLQGKVTPERAAERLISIEAGSDTDVTMDVSALSLPLPAAMPRGGLGKG